MFDARHAMAVLAIVGAFTYAIVSALARARVRELEIRERIAMIEKGMIPPPDSSVAFIACGTCARLADSQPHVIAAPESPSWPLGSA